jgi:LAO/AO transport system kinase
MTKQKDISTLLDGIINGNIASLSSAITLIESQKSSHQQLAIQLIEATLPYTGKAKRIGITGVPGVGKSTFIEAFGMFLIQQGLKVAVLAIDPSSTVSRGSILGDKTRMEQLAIQPKAFIRPSASSGSLGGVTYKTRETMLLCEAAGYDIIIIETVGVGQSETEIAQITDFFLLLMLAGAGDELQGIKRGIMEMADGMVITKADGENITKAKTARSEYARALHFFPPSASGWIPQVKLASSYNATGIEEIWEMIQNYYLHLHTNGHLQIKREAQNKYAFHKLLNEQLRLMFVNNSQTKTTLEAIEQRVIEGTLSPYNAVMQVIKAYPLQ